MPGGRKPSLDGGIVLRDGWVKALLVAVVAALVLVVPGYAFAVDEPGIGYLKVKCKPEVPTVVYVDGVPMDGWGIKNVELASGEHVVSFSDVPGFATPEPVIASIVSGGTVSMVVGFVQLALLQVVCEPAVKSTVYIDGIPRNDYGVWAYVEPGAHSVSFGEVEGYDPPDPQVVDIPAGDSAIVVGAFTLNPEAGGPTGFGCLRVETSPALPTTIYVDGIPRDCWGLAWLKLPVGPHEISFSDVPRFTTPDPVVVDVSECGVVQVTATFIQQGGLRVVTAPPNSATVYIDGLARDSWGIWLDLPSGWYTVSFGDIPGHVTPAPQTVFVVPGQTTLVVGE